MAGHAREKGFLRELEDKHWVTWHPHPGRSLQASLSPASRAGLAACHRAAGTIEERSTKPLA
jgi:MarR-like DNA-binding transcriptional regulator SgrR of sgrS sRNA